MLITNLVGVALSLARIQPPATTKALSLVRGMVISAWVTDRSLVRFPPPFLILYRSSLNSAPREASLKGYQITSLPIKASYRLPTLRLKLASPLPTQPTSAGPYATSNSRPLSLLFILF